MDRDANELRQISTSMTKAAAARALERGDATEAMRHTRSMVDGDDEFRQGFYEAPGRTDSSQQQQQQQQQSPVRHGAGGLFGSPSTILGTSGDEAGRGSKQEQLLQEEVRMLREQHQRAMDTMDNMRTFMEKMEKAQGARSQSPAGQGGLFGGSSSSRPTAAEEEELRKRLGRPPSGLRDESEGAGRSGWKETWRPPAEGTEEVRRAPPERGAGSAGASAEPPAPKASEFGSDIRDVFSGLAALGRGELGMSGDLLGNEAGRGLDRFGGSRGAVAFAKEQLRFEEDPLGALKSVDRAGREMCGVRAGQPHRLEDAVLQLPLGTYMTKKRSGYLMACAAEALLQDNMALAAGILAQGIRWISLSLTLKDEDAAWKITYMKDPKDRPTPAAPSRPDLLQCQLQDVRQLTALCGLLKDEDSLGLRMQRAGRPPKKKGQKPEGEG